VSYLRRVYVGSVLSVSMIRPEVDDEVMEMVDEIIDTAVTVPLSSDELSYNQKLRIVATAVHEEIEENDTTLVVDRN
jgi:phosphoribosylpyrophosphate synthetase